MSEIISVSHLTTQYTQGVTIHEDISFSVKKREIFGILGGSGSGKSTLLRNMIYLQRPVSGQIQIFGRDIWELEDSKRHLVLDRCSVMFQFGALFSSMNVLDNVGMPLVQRGNLPQKHINEIAAFWCERVGLPTQSVYKYPYALSGGMKKRVALARALITSPDILFLDEPTSGLDPKSAQNFDTLILQLKEILNITIVMVTHDLDSIRDSIDRFILLENKKIAFCGSLEQLMASGVRTEIFSGNRGERILDSHG